MKAQQRRRATRKAELIELRHLSVDGGRYRSTAFLTSSPMLFVFFPLYLHENKQKSRVGWMKYFIYTFTNGKTSPRKETNSRQQKRRKSNGKNEKKNRASLKLPRKCATGAQGKPMLTKIFVDAVERLQRWGWQGVRGNGRA